MNKLSIEFVALPRPNVKPEDCPSHYFVQRGSSAGKLFFLECYWCLLTAAITAEDYLAMTGLSFVRELHEKEGLVELQAAGGPSWCVQCHKMPGELHQRNCRYVLAAEQDDAATR